VKERVYVEREKAESIRRERRKKILPNSENGVNLYRGGATRKIRAKGAVGLGHRRPAGPWADRPFSRGHSRGSSRRLVGRPPEILEYLYLCMWT
jgi:hypothetical protein